MKSVFLSVKNRGFLLLMTMFIVPAIAVIGIVFNEASLHQSAREIFGSFIVLSIIFLMAFLSFEFVDGLSGSILLIFGIILAVFLFIKYPVLIFLTILVLDFLAYFMLIDC
jgi:hypothetical protein